MNDTKSRPSLLTILGDGLLLLCALLGLAGSFLSLYGDGRLGRLMHNQATPLDQCAAWTDSLLVLAAVFALLSLAAWSLPRFRGVAAGGLAALWGAAVFLSLDSVIQGAGLTIRTITLLFAQRVDWGRVFQYDPELTQVQEGAAARLFLILTLAGLALALGWAIVRARRWWIAALLTLPPLLPGLLADLYPSWPPFLALAACWCAMLLCDLCKWAAPDRRGRLTLAALAGAAAMLTAILLLFPQEGYTRPQWALNFNVKLEAAHSRLTDFFSRFDGPFGGGITYVGAAEEADLTGAGPLRHTGRTVLRVNSSCGGRLYLRGSSLAAYDGGVWRAPPQGAWQGYLDGLSEPDAPNPLLPFPDPSLGGGGDYTVTVDNVGQVGSCVYAPYYPAGQDWTAAGMLPVEDAYLARAQDQWVHTISFGPRQTYPDGYAAEAASAYRDYVYQHYLDVPMEYREELARFCMANGVSDAARYGESYDPVQAAREVAALLDWWCAYDPEAPAAPAGEDPVLYFLDDSRRGYCMHYASAAALMLRSLGIPARYVSGFTVEAQPGRWVSVPDRAAHAWVEVWVSGFGWYPVEVTPAAAFTWYEAGPEVSFELPSEPIWESGEPDPTHTPAPTPTQAPSPSAQTSQGSQPEEGDPPPDSPAPAVLIPLLKGMAAAAGALALLWLAQYLPKKYRAARLSAADRNRAALYGYRCLERMGRWGGRVDERALELAQKARFSQHTLTAEELDELRAMVDRERERLCVILDPLPRLAFRLLWGTPRKKTAKSPKKGA